MGPVPRIRFALRRSLDRALVVIAVAALLLGVFQYAVMPVDGPVGFILRWLPVIFWAYIAGGIIAWRRRPSNPMGFLIVVAGIIIYLGLLGNATIPMLQAIGAIFASVALAATLHLLLAFPSGRLTRPALWIVIAGYVVAVVLQAPHYLLDPNGPFPPFAIADAPALAAILGTVQDVSGAVVMVAAAVVLFQRARRADRPQRRVLIPLFVYGIVTVLYTPVSTFLGVDLLGMDPLVRTVIQLALITGIPVVVAVGILRGGFARTSELEELATWLGSATRPSVSLEALLATALGDPTLKLGVWVAERDAFVGDDGAELGRPAADAGWHVIERDGRTIGAFTYDAQLQADRDVVARAGNVVAIAVEGEQLTAELLASREALLRSRERIVEAADRERRRIAGDLHDGLQAQLVMLALEAHRLASAPAADVPARALRLRADIDAAASDLRAFVHDLVPAALIERGLAAAAEDLVDRMPIATVLEDEMDGADVDPAVENTAYHVIAEGLSNIVKHAHARTARVHLSHDRDLLRVEIIDDGSGTAAIDHGTGLRGLADRVDAAGGVLTVRSEPGSGTTLRAELPCAS
ncbi:sensor histidine kinase [Microbacterium sp. ASV49]|uniref:histidine kinase n=1 Tax=Microbacterium candidum TaxID=3041922 RepID=A0ABT7MTH8_9MICO|nr:sensor histidine kinase [Microbacterium sp. ASV49]MDL9977754.1 sensor histidine kinase [Microbacterium sp. ASV49]